MRRASVRVEARLINENQPLTHVCHSSQDVIVPLLEESGLIPLVWNGGHGLPGNVDSLEHLLDGSLGDLDIEFVFDVLDELLEGSA